MNKAIIRYTLITSTRDLLYSGMFALILIAVGVSAFLGSTALAEQQQMMITYAAGSIRVIINVGLVMFVCFHVARMLENKEISFILSKPVSRSSFVISYWSALVCIAFIVVIFSGLILTSFSGLRIPGLFMWTSSLLCEAVILMAFALSLTLITESSIVSALSTFLFYTLARMIGFFIVVEEANLLYSPGLMGRIAFKFMNAISMILPRLDMFGKSAWLIYEITDKREMFWYPAQSLAYIPLLLFVSVYDINKKQF